MKTKLREFEYSKTEAKIQATRLWKEGVPISQIAKDTQKSRETIYRWLKQIDHKLAKHSSRKRKSLDEQARFRLIEVFILLKRPKMPKLQKVLKSLYHIELSQPQLRRFLKKFGLSFYRPSAFYDHLLRQQFEISTSKEKRSDNAF
ncbi:MAG: helix-turn-helix domain-containing protein [Dechloromonas sp.]|nr:helix-turn-helix domain-containing protein [Dechloromonas sp.]MBN8555358.1 helix-turn-helix domain-containing protein [Deltaproteobacteria bacterium]